MLCQIEEKINNTSILHPEQITENQSTLVLPATRWPSELQIGDAEEKSKILGILLPL